MNKSSYYLAWLILAALPVGSDQHNAGTGLQERSELAFFLFDDVKEGFHEEEEDHPQFDDEEEKDKYEMSFTFAKEDDFARIVDPTIPQKTSESTRRLCSCDIGTYCLDCDKCRQYDLDCGACLEEGCVYCPKDGLCASGSILQAFSSNVKVPACSSQDYQSLSCAAGGDANVFNDPMYTEQSWVYDLIDVQPVWRRGFTGKGVHIRINDQGVNGHHPELSARFDKEGSCEIYLPHDGHSHGTTCAAIAAGEADNNECSAGIAPGATVSSCAVKTFPFYPSREAADGYSYLAHGIEYVDISSNSWNIDACGNKGRRPIRQGDRMLQEECRFPTKDAASSPCDDCSDEMLALTTAPGAECIKSINHFCYFNYEGHEDLCQEYIDLFVECTYNMLTTGERTTIEHAIREGRAGKGMIYTFAAGNENKNGEDSNMEGFMHSRYTISVAAVGRDGLHASYSTPGAPNLITAPGGDSEFIHNHVVAFAGGGCYDATYGTSFATPVVSGVIALMLDVNPELGWRDVQAILALTARETDPDDESWVTNGAGLRHSNKYGFGIVNANSAVNMAETWVTYPPELELTAESGPIDLVIPDDADQTVESTLSICKGQNGFTVESVVIFIGYQHGMRGNLNIMLTSPSGTASALHPSKRYERTTLLEGTRWELMTVRNWGESPVGDWTLSVTDERLGDGDLPNASSVNYLKNWDISIYGRVEEAGSPSPILRMPHILTLAGLATVTFFL